MAIALSAAVSGLEAAEPVGVKIPSSLDGEIQKCLWLAPDQSINRKIEESKNSPAPLLVSLHTWSKGYNMENPVPPRWCEAKGWAYIAPNFRGPNNKPKALGSDFAVQDIVDAVEWAKKNANIDENRIYLLGGSGGGHMALLMAGRHPEIWAGVAAFCPITDIAKWYEFHSRTGREDRYAVMMHSACGGTLAEKPDEYARRSPVTYLKSFAELKVYIGTGIHDGYKGSVPVCHAMWGYNALAAPEDRIPDELIETIVKTQKVPDGAVIDNRRIDESTNQKILDPDYVVPIHLRRTSGNVRFTLFEGAHDILPTQGLHWLENQAKGRSVVWDLPPLEGDFPLEKWGLAK